MNGFVPLARQKKRATIRYFLWTGDEDELDLMEEYGIQIRRGCPIYIILISLWD